MRPIYKITALFLLIPLLSFAKNDGPKHEKNKVIKKEFLVNADALVSLNNRYGNLNITTWDKNKVEIEVTVTVKGDYLDAVKEKLSSIRILFNSSPSLVAAETTFENKKNSWSLFKKNNNINYKINYVVKMPMTNSVDLDNDYGNINLNKISGKADINCDYGKISIGDLFAKDNSINLDYCSSSTINFMKSGSLNIDYSKINVNTSEKLNVNSDYSTVKLGKTKNVDMNVDYGAVTVDEANDVSINSDYASIRIGTIRKNLDIDAEYGSIRIKKLANNFNEVLINAEYTGVRIGIASDAVFDFEIDLQYASFKRDENKIELFKSISKSSKKYYQGKYGRGNTNSKLKIKSQYGGVSIQENN